MTRFNFVLFVLWTLAVLALCQDDDEPKEEIVDKDIVRGVVEVCG